jgi:hypothetical protein
LVVFSCFWLFLVVFCCCWLLVRWVVVFGFVGLGCCSCVCGLWRVGRNGEIVGVVLFFGVLFVVEEFVVRVFAGGKVTVPKRLRDLLGVRDGDYVRLALVEVLRRGEGGWVKRGVSR